MIIKNTQKIGWYLYISKMTQKTLTQKFSKKTTNINKFLKIKRITTKNTLYIYKCPIKIK